MALPEHGLLVSMWAVPELQPGKTMGTLEQRAVSGLPAMGQPHSTFPYPATLATTLVSCFQPFLSMGMAFLGPAGREGLGRSSAPSAFLSCAHSSWTEDTRARIFSESPTGHSLLETPCEELERRIEGKLKEFEALAASGQQLVSEEHYLSATVRTGKWGWGASVPPEILWGQALEEGARCRCRAPVSGMGLAMHPWGCSGQEGVSPSNGC